MADLPNNGNELQQGSWELTSPNFGSPHSTFLGPARPGDTKYAGAALSGGGDGGSLLDLALDVGLFTMMENHADSSMFDMVTKSCDLRVPPSVHYKQSGDERRLMNSAAPPPQPPRRANQQNYTSPTGRQLSRSVPSSPTFATRRVLHMNAAMVSGGGSGAPTARPAGRGNVLPAVARYLSAHMNSSQQASSSASVLTASLDLASCTSNLVPPSPGSIRSASFSGDHAAAATAASFSSDHAAKSAKFSADQFATTPRTSEHVARSANLGSDQASAARPAIVSGDQASRSASFSSELAAAASFFLPLVFPSTPASSTTSSQNPPAAAAEQDDHQVQEGASGSCTGAKKRRLQPAGAVKSMKSSSKAEGEADVYATPDTLAPVLTQGGANVDIATIEPEMSNNSANIEGEESTMKGNSSITSSSTCMKTQVFEGPPPPKQDYIHVRARRGQATDSHSLAERVRREKISERMKFLQDLVPGCNKITGKAVMLDEIINYVQSLQRQVEFLSMKLSAVSPQTGKFEANHLINHVDPESIQLGTSLHFNQMENHHHQHDLHLSMPLLLDAQQQQVGPQHQLQPSNMDVPQAWEDELQSLVQMGFSTLP